MSDRIKRNGARAVAMGLGFARDKSVFASTIAVVTEGPMSHMFLAFRLSDGREIYFEALISRNVDGPRDLADVRAWHKKRPGRIVLVEWTNASSDLAHKKMLECEADVDRRRAYGKLQLLSMLILERTGIAIGSMRRDIGDRVVCSEFVAEKLYPFFDLRDSTHKTFSSVNPNSAWRAWVKNGEHYRVV
jgi:hypothetical protein